MRSSGTELRQVRALWDRDNQILFSSFIGEILFEFPAELPGLYPDYIVFVAVEIRTPVKDVNSDLLFRYFYRTIGKQPPGDVQQKIA